MFWLFEELDPEPECLLSSLLVEWWVIITFLYLCNEVNYVHTFQSNVVSWRFWGWYSHMFSLYHTKLVVFMSVAVLGIFLQAFVCHSSAAPRLPSIFCEKCRTSFLNQLLQSDILLQIYRYSYFFHLLSCRVTQPQCRQWMFSFHCTLYSVTHVTHCTLWHIKLMFHRLCAFKSSRMCSGVGLVPSVYVLNAGLREYALWLRCVQSEPCCPMGSGTLDRPS